MRSADLIAKMLTKQHLVGQGKHFSWNRASIGYLAATFRMCLFRRLIMIQGDHLD